MIACIFGGQITSPMAGGLFLYCQRQCTNNPKCDWVIQERENAKKHTHNQTQLREHTPSFCICREEEIGLKHATQTRPHSPTVDSRLLREFCLTDWHSIEGARVSPIAPPTHRESSSSAFSYRALPPFCYTMYIKYHFDPLPFLFFFFRLAGLLSS